jgi:lysozyme family protein
MADFNLSIDIILKHEGGFVNHPSDPGGATNRGIIFTLFKQYSKALGLLPTIDALKSLTEDQAKFIYREHFWNPMKGDEIINQNIADILFDGYVNMGGKALKMMQKEAGTTLVDGSIGADSIRAINLANARVLFQGYKDSRIKFYIDLADRKPKMKVFLKGWLNRINSFEYKGL